ncbi:urease accessory protein UreF [Burkholderiales bacterium JOSHI_001]|nr:urease accessory protein UreF [Burkholderiales bacterium JOSHI_001]
MTRRTRIRTDRPPRLSAPSLLQLMRLASPSLPVGGFSYSEGMESAVEQGRVGNEADARAWLLDQLQLVLARSELPLAARAWRAWLRGDLDTVRELNTWHTLTRDGAESAQQAAQMGRSLVEWLRIAHPGDERVAQLAALRPAPCWPVAFALATQRCGAPCRDSLLALALGWAENMTQAAIKSVPLGQSAAQRLLAALSEAIPAVVDQALALPDSQRQAFAPMLAVLSAQHETQYSRLFRS